MSQETVPLVDISKKKPTRLLTRRFEKLPSLTLSREQISILEPMETLIEASTTINYVILVPMGVRQYYVLLTDSDVERILRKYALADDYSMAVNELSLFVDKRVLASLLYWLADVCGMKGYELEGFILIKDIEYNEPLTVAIHIRGCGFNEWDSLAKSVKQQLRYENLTDLARKVTLVCVDALKEISQGLNLTRSSI